MDITLPYGNYGRLLYEWLRQLLQCFQGIHVVILNGTKQVVNLTKERSNILEYLPQGCRKYYVFS